MTKTTKTGKDTIETEAVSASDRGARPKRRTVYERKDDTAIPEALQEHFRKDNYEVRYVRWEADGQEDYRYLGKREDEGYEFVTADELPEWFKRSVRVVDSKSRPGLVISGDLCLMKIDVDLRNSRRRFFEQETSKQVQAVDINVLEKKGFRNLGTKSKVMMKEPDFQE